MSSVDARPRVLLVGGGGGLVGRALLPELDGVFQIRSIHRHPVAMEASRAVEWVAADVGRVENWRSIVRGVDAIVNLAWYRWGSRRRFERLARGLHGMLEAARSSGVRRVVQVSVPAAPPELERSLPYLYFKRQVDRELLDGGFSARILRPSALFAPGDVLLGVMLRTIHRYGRLPMFGDGAYHLSPLAAADLSRVIRQELQGNATGTLDLGGPTRYTYRALTEIMFHAMSRPARYWRLTERGAVRLATVLQLVGSRRLYAYEVHWLMADLLGLPPYAGLDRPLTTVEAYLAAEAARLTGAAPPSAQMQ